MYVYRVMYLYNTCVSIYIYSKSILFAHHTYAEYDIHISA